MKKKVLLFTMLVCCSILCACTDTSKPSTDSQSSEENTIQVTETTVSTAFDETVETKPVPTETETNPGEEVSTAPSESEASASESGDTQPIATETVEILYLGENETEMN